MDARFTTKRALSFRPSPRPETSFFLAGNAKAVFCQAHQRIYALNDTAAFIWCHLQDGGSADAIANAMAKAGIDQRVSAKYVHGAIQKWLRIGLLRPDYTVDVPSWPVQQTLDIMVGGYAASLRVADEHLAHLLFPLFEHLSAPVRVPDEVISAVDIDGVVHVVSGENFLFCGSLAEIAPLVLGHVIDRTLEACGPDPVFHSACVVRGERCLMIGGRSGAGKSTLTLRLLHAGFQYAGDDVAIISEKGARGLPFAPGMKSGSWELIGRFRPDLEAHPIHRRYDRKRMRYIKPSPVAPDRSRPIGWFVFLRRGPGRAKLNPIEPMDAVTRIVSQLISPGRTLTSAMLHGIKRNVLGAAAFELAYSDLDDASEALTRLCHE
jgi:hypothetical protein